MSDVSLSSNSSFNVSGKPSVSLPRSNIPKGHRRTAVVLIPACSNQVGIHAAHTVQRKYADAVFYGSQCTTLFIPAMGKELDIDVLLDTADGVFLSGSPSNVNAELYGETISEPHLPQDVFRDEVTIPLIRQAVARIIPPMLRCVLARCECRSLAPNTTLPPMGRRGWLAWVKRFSRYDAQPNAVQKG